MSSQPPRRRRRRRPQSESESDSPLPRRRKKKSGTSGKKKRKKSANHAALLKIALIAGIGIVLLGGLFMVDWQDVGVAVGMDRSPEKQLTDLKYYQKKQLDLIASFQDKEQAKAAIPQLNEITKELAIISAEHDDWHTIEEEDEIQEHLKLAPEIRERMSQISQEIGQLRSKHESLLREEISRLKGNAAFKLYVTHLVLQRYIGPQRQRSISVSLIPFRRNFRRVRLVWLSRA
ncbi:hypothetical protein Pan153_39940 [Gimesia panareensis]|uniref:Uncharacterized protein n=1 Tax=Gimesia panareensis TaxID=2527978 RepID=A0A518FSL4_9PLAN|nr:hypothetical protein [Gimesia panareensis]QDV19329.1 hypothetical protein Pan153_39940 [Gimesia panareensis]